MDPHTHIDAEHMAARGLDDILLYHMSVSDLYAAGCPGDAREDELRCDFGSPIAVHGRNCAEQELRAPKEANWPSSLNNESEKYPLR